MTHDQIVAQAGDIDTTDTADTDMMGGTPIIADMDRLRGYFLSDLQTAVRRLGELLVHEGLTRETELLREAIGTLPLLVSSSVTQEQREEVVTLLSEACHVLDERRYADNEILEGVH